MAIAMCVSLIAGATFAFFTSESQVNIAVTSGNVEVSATVENVEKSYVDENGETVEGNLKTANLRSATSYPKIPLNSTSKS